MGAGTNKPKTVVGMPQPPLRKAVHAQGGGGVHALWPCCDPTFMPHQSYHN